MENVIALVNAVNEILSERRKLYSIREARRSMAREAREVGTGFQWAQGTVECPPLSEEQIAAKIFEINKNAYTLVIKEKRKYINIDTAAGSGKFMINKQTGGVFGTKGYGVIHTGHYYGDVSDVDTPTRMANVLI